MNELGIFAKYWEAGGVKTRLAARLGGQPAADLYRAFLAFVLARFDGLADRRVLAFTPDGRGRDFAPLAAGRWQLQPQGEGDLGARIARYLAAALRRGARRVVLVGSDSPLLPPAHVEQAFRLLGQCDVVLGPSDDGGYYLVGASSAAPRIFDDIPWSTPDVWAQSLARIQREGLRFAALPPHYDVDEIDDLQRLRDELQAMAGEGGDAVDALRAAVESALSPPPPSS